MEAMLRAGTEIRYRLATILVAHWDKLVSTYQGWIRPVIVETVRKILACQTPALGCRLYRCSFPWGDSGRPPLVQVAILSSLWQAGDRPLG